MRCFLLLAVLLPLAACAKPDVWMKPGASAGDFEVSKGRCMAAGYLQVPAAPAVASFGTGYQAPMFTNCSAFGNLANCTTTGGQYTPPPSFSYDANAGVRAQVFKGCMYGEGWSLERQSDATPASAESDWIKGYKWGVSHHENAVCESLPPGISIASGWDAGCRAAQREHRTSRQPSGLPA
jgi:hypothetical protein